MSFQIAPGFLLLNSSDSVWGDKAHPAKQVETGFIIILAPMETLTVQYSLFGRRWTD